VGSPAVSVDGENYLSGYPSLFFAVVIPFLDEQDFGLQGEYGAAGQPNVGADACCCPQHVILIIHIVDPVVPKLTPALGKTDTWAQGRCTEREYSRNKKCVFFSIKMDRKRVGSWQLFYPFEY
jgi:hypothetical protein